MKSKSTIINNDTKIKRRWLQNNCKIGKKVNKLRLIVVEMAAICQIPDENKLNNEIKIPLL
jgi:hypothetical protein